MPYKWLTQYSNRKRCVQLDIQRNNGAILFDEIVYSEGDHKTVPYLISFAQKVASLRSLCGHDAKSYAGVIFATGRASHAGKVMGDDPNRRYPRRPSWGLGREAILNKKNLIAEKPNNVRWKGNTG